MTVLLRKIAWFVFWMLIIGLSIYFYFVTFWDYAHGYIPPNFLKGFFESKIWYIGHVLGASASLLLGRMQFWNFILIGSWHYQAAERTDVYFKTAHSRVLPLKGHFISSK